jgi:hypothetical protein
MAELDAETREKWFDLAERQLGQILDLSRRMAVAEKALVLVKVGARLPSVRSRSKHVVIPAEAFSAVQEALVALQVKV